jgi:hypothetical protein
VWVLSRTALRDLFSTKRFILTAWVAVAVYLFGCAISAVLRSQSDFYIYRDAGLRTALGKHIYDLNDLDPFQYAPIYALFFIPFGRLPVRWAQALWFLISMAVALPALILGTGRLLFGAKSTLRAELILAPVLLCTRFILPSFDQGQSDLIVLAMIAWGLAFASESKARLGGALLAASVLIKPLALPPLVYLMFRRRWSAIVSFVCFTLLLLAVPAVVLGAGRAFSETSDYISSLSGRVHVQRLLHDLASPYDQSPTALSVRVFSQRKGGLAWFETGTAASIGFLYQFILMLLVIRWATLHRTQSGEDDLLAISAVFAMVPALLPTVWLGYYTALMVPYMGLLAIGLSTPIPGSLCSNVALVVIAISFILNVAGRFSNTAMFYGAPYVGSLVILSGIVVIRSEKELNGSLNIDRQLAR